MKLYDLIKDGSHLIFADNKDDAVLEQLPVKLIDSASREVLGNLNDILAKAKEQGEKVLFLNDGKGGIKLIKGNEELNVGVAYEDKSGKLHLIIPTPTNTGPIPNYVVMVGDKGYESIYDALAEIVEGDIIKLVADIDISATGLLIDESQDLSLDLNGHELKASNATTGNIQIAGKLSLLDSSDDKKDGTGKGKLYTTTPYKRNVTDHVIVEVKGGGLFKMESGLIDAASFTDDHENLGQFAVGMSDTTSTKDANVIINGGHIKAGWYAVAGNGNVTKANHNIIINGGLLESVADYAIYHPQTGTTTVNGGVVYGAAGGVQSNRGNLIINGGIVTSRGIGDTGEWGDGTGGTSNAAISSNAKYGNVVVKIADGKITAEGDAIVINTGSKYESDIKITGGVFSEDVTKYLEEGYEIVKDGDNYKVVKSTKE